MAQGKVLGKSGGGLNIQGIIEQYTALGNINAGDFVDYLKNYVPDTSIADTRNSGTTYSTITILSVVALSDTKVFIAYSWLYANNPAYHLYGIVCTISGTTITVGTPTVLVGNSVTTQIKATNLSLVKIAEDKVCIAYNYNNNDETIYLIVCTISGTTITKGTDTTLYNSSNNQAKYISATLLSEDKVFVCYGNGSKTYGMVCTISDTTITKGTHTELYGNGNSIPQANSSVVALSDTKVFIALGVDSYRHLYGIVCTISGTTITVNTYIPLNILYEAGKYMSLIKLSADEVFIAYGTENSNMYGMICTISDNDIKIRINKSIAIKDYNVSATLLSADKIFIAHKLIGDDYLYGMIEQLGVFTTNSQQIYGVARTKGTVGDTVPVIVPNIN